MKPVIAITPNFNKPKNTFTLNKDYADAIIKAEGVPYIPAYYDEKHIEEILSRCQGLILSGGGDIHARFFAQELHPKANSVNTERDIFELRLCLAALERNFPMLCICRGMQVLNVALGGDILQHIEGHSFRKPSKTHAINVNKNTRLHEIFQCDKIQVNSRHHQSVGLPGKSIKITGFSEDGIVEAIEFEKAGFCIGLQWHPETMVKNHDQQLLPFKALVDYAAGL